MNHYLKAQKLLVVGVFSLVASLPLSVSAFESSVIEDEVTMMEKKYHQMGQKQLKKMQKYLELTTEQVEKIKLIKEQSREQIQPLKENVRLFFTSLKVLKENPIFDEALFNATYAQYQDTFAQLALQKAKTKHAVYHVLTPEQQEKWSTFKAKKKGKRNSRF